MTTPRRLTAFTLVELIIVMALLAIVMAVAAPSLARSMKERNLADEAARFLSATEYARSEAVSQGVPMIVWIEPTARRMGVAPKTGFEGEETRVREFVWNPDIRIETEEKAAGGKVIELMEFGADGAPTVTSAESIRLVDRFDAALTLARTTDRWSYEILKEAR